MGKLLKSLISGVKSFKSPSKEKPVKDKSLSHSSKREARDHERKRNKEKCMWSLGKSSSRSRDAVPTAPSPDDAIEIKCVQVDSEKLKDVIPIAESFAGELCMESKDPVKSQEVANIGNEDIELSQTDLREHIVKVSNREEWAAGKIQAAFRCYLAQRAFRALHALVRLQALARGRNVRKQVSTSLRCMRALIRLQALARGHHVRSSELGQLVQKHLHQTRQSKKKPAEGWVNSTATTQQLHVKAQSKQDAIMKRHRTLVYSFSEQLNKRTLKQSSSLEIDNEIDRTHWIWVWLERWTAARNVEKAKTASDVNNLVEVMASSPRAHPSIKEQQKTSTIVAKRDEKAKTPTQTEKLGILKVKSAESSSATSAVGKQCRSLSLLAASTTHEVSLSRTAPPSACTNELTVNDLLSAPETVVTAASCISLNPATCTTQLAGVAIPSSKTVLPCSSKPATCAIQPSGAIVSMTVDTDLTSPIGAAQQLLSPSVSNTSSVKSGLTFSIISQPDDVAESTYMKSNTNSLSTVSCLPVELCSELESLSPNVSTREYVPDLAQEDMPEGTFMPGNTVIINGDAVTSEAASVIHEDTDSKNDETVQVDALSEANGGCGASVVSVSVKSVEASNQPANQEEMADCASPYVPSYMATTKSSKAKVRTLTSPKQKSESSKSESPKPKSDSPKLKSDSLKLKSDSPKLKSDSPKLNAESAKLKVESATLKSDTATNRLHSLSALEGKASSSPGMQIQRPSLHVRASSKGQLGLVKDTSTDNSPLSNGGSRRHAK